MGPQAGVLPYAEAGTLLLWSQDRQISTPSKSARPGQPYKIQKDILAEHTLKNPL